MVAGVSVDLDLAKDQWNNLKSTIEKAGAEVKVVPPSEEYPDLVFTANSGIINDKNVLIANFKYEERRGEEKLYMGGLAIMAIPLDEYHQSLNLKEEAMLLFMVII